MRFLLLCFLLAAPLFGACEEIQAVRELRVFKDPELFRPLLQRFVEDEKEGWYRLSQESPLRNTVKGRFRFERVGPAQDFGAFSALARLYELAEGKPLVASPRMKATIIPIRLCEDGGFGFVLESELVNSQKAETSETPQRLPSSVYPNPIPDYPSRGVKK